MGNLTQNDLVPGGLYKSGAGWIVRFWPETASMEVLWAPYKIDIGKIIPLRALCDWEGIPITPELLEDWYVVSVWRDSYHIQDGIWLDSRANGLWKYKSSLITHIHDLQRLVLALTGKPLKGGPK